MDFPPVPEQEPLGPSRRIGGEYTLTKRLILAPVQIECTEGLEETLILGRDGSTYRGTQKYPSKIELDKKLGGTKRPIQKITSTSSSRGYVEPSVVSLHSSDKLPLYGKISKSLVEFPKTEIANVLALIKEKSMKVKNEEIADTTALDESTEKPEEQETDSEVIQEMTSELEESSGPEETATEVSDTETAKSDTDELVEEEESIGTGETKETAAEELDAGKLTQEDESLDIGETKQMVAEESDADKLVQEDESLGTGETKETAVEESVGEIIKLDTDESAKVEGSLNADDTKDVSDI